SKWCQVRNGSRHLGPESQTPLPATGFASPGRAGFPAIVVRSSDLPCSSVIIRAGAWAGTVRESAQRSFPHSPPCRLLRLLLRGHFLAVREHDLIGLARLGPARGFKRVIGRG